VDFAPVIRGRASNIALPLILPAATGANPHLTPFALKVFSKYDSGIFAAFSAPFRLVVP